MLGLIDRLTILTEDPTTGAYSVVFASGIACRFAHHVVGTGAGGADAGARASLVAQRHLLWDAGATMPDGWERGGWQVENEADGSRWQPLPGSMTQMRGPGGRVHHYRADLERQDTTP